MVTVVIGIRRSGTSMVAETLHRLGVCMGEQWHNPDEQAHWNPNGFWEDVEFGSVMKDLFSGNKTLENGMFVGLGGCELQPLREIVVRRMKKYQHWGVKNFLMPLFLPHFSELCGGAQNVNLIWVDRGIALPMHSLVKLEPHKKIADVLPQLAHELYNIDSSFILHQGRKLKLDYNTMIEEPELYTRFLANFVKLPFRPEAVIADKKHRHYR